MKEEIFKAMRDEASKIEQEYARKRQEQQEQQAAKKLAETNSLLESEKFADECSPHIEAVAKEIEGMYGDCCEVFFNDKPESLKKKHTHGFGAGVRIVTKEVERMGDRASAYFWVSPGTDGALCEWKKFGPNLKPEFSMVKPAEQFIKNRLKNWAVEVVGYLQTSIEQRSPGKAAGRTRDHRAA